MISWREGGPVPPLCTDAMADVLLVRVLQLKDGRGSHPTRETDLYSCGVLLRHLLDQAAAPLKQEDHASSSAEAAKALAAMSASLCDPDPAKRPSAAHALAALQPSATNNGPMAPAA